MNIANIGCNIFMAAGIEMLKNQMHLFFATSRNPVVVKVPPGQLFL